MKCPTCNGTGWYIPLFNKREQCPDCPKSNPPPTNMANLSSLRDRFKNDFMLKPILEMGKIQLKTDPNIDLCWAAMQPANTSQIKVFDNNRRMPIFILAACTSLDNVDAAFNELNQAYHRSLWRFLVDKVDQGDSVPTQSYSISNCKSVNPDYYIEADGPEYAIHTTSQNLVLITRDGKLSSNIWDDAGLGHGFFMFLEMGFGYKDPSNIVKLVV